MTAGSQNDWLTLPAPAKLNLMLHILGRRPDGYHELETLFQFLDYSDTLYFRPRVDGRRAGRGVGGSGRPDHFA